MSLAAGGLSLANGLDPERLAGAFARHSRLHLPGLLPKAQAKAVGQALAGPTPWHKSMHVGGKSYDYFSLKAAEAQLGDISKLPFTLKVLLENLLRFEDERSVTTKDVQAIVDWQKEKKSDKENVEVLVRGINSDLHRHAEEIDRLHTRVSGKVGTETMWKIVGLTLGVGTAVGGLIGYLINLTLRLKP